MWVQYASNPKFIIRVGSYSTLRKMYCENSR